MHDTLTISLRRTVLAARSTGTLHYRRFLRKKASGTNHLTSSTNSFNTSLPLLRESIQQIGVDNCCTCLTSINLGRWSITIEAHWNIFAIWKILRVKIAVSLPVTSYADVSLFSMRFNFALSNASLQAIQTAQ